MKFSIVSVLNDPTRDLSHFFQRIMHVMGHFEACDYELIIVNNFESHLALSDHKRAYEDQPIVCINLSRKFALHNAILAGLAAAKGEYTFFISAEQGDNPEWLLDLINMQHETQSDMVYATYPESKKNSLCRLGRHWARKFLKIEPNMVAEFSARLMTRRYLNALLSHKERELNLSGLAVLTGFQQSALLVNLSDAIATPKRSVLQKIDVLIHTTLSFSNHPLILAFYASIMIALSLVCCIAALILRYFFVTKLLNGYASLIVSIWFFSGLIIFFIGVQGIYIAKIFSEIKQRPYTIIRQIYKQNKLR